MVVFVGFSSFFAAAQQELFRFLIFSDTFVNFTKTACAFFLCIVIYIGLISTIFWLIFSILATD